ncbi:DUF4230 domain-containing protein [Sinomicrobium soli]|uniref:DUF4230 domain-containing protein n=1 Tax=Sinomicrobium sp. N-1-3-6 TaxID=2219864 RepID=UPI000DCB04D9|nr:DUF4230 domain-containing protein [Sinomicrobium sp. N-1-3-6]RAV27474.1 hypothetical protein DN748_18495 [Sinomicrobium sp. N-1-3-6]
MRKPLLISLVILLLVVCIWQYYHYRGQEQQGLLRQTAVIQEQIRNVGKLIVTEGSYSQVFTYEDSKKFYLDFLSEKKRALVVVNATAQVSYDLSKIRTEIDETGKTLRITSIPEPELHISPDIEYYDVQQGYFNRFEADDHNRIKRRIERSLQDKIKNSPLMENAGNRLISELYKFYILTSSMGWTLEYNEHTIDRDKDFRGYFPELPGQVR